MPECRSSMISLLCEIKFCIFRLTGSITMGSLSIIERSTQKKQKAIADRIEALLKKRGMTQRDLARKIGMKDSAISRILHCEANLTLETITELEHGLDDLLISVL